jgi:Uma2 family endonuclease
MSSTGARATVTDLHRTEGRAELVGGRIVRLPLFGRKPGEVVGNVAFSLHEYERRTGRGEVGTATLAYVIPPLPSGRESFSPSVSYSFGPYPENPMDFLPGPPTFAVEVRGEEDYAPAAEAEMAAKRADYFQAGTLVVWDVDPLAETITAYRGDPHTPVAVFRAGDVADAEPAVPGWRVPVDEIFA